MSRSGFLAWLTWRSRWWLVLFLDLFICWSLARISSCNPAFFYWIDSIQLMLCDGFFLLFNKIIQSLINTSCSSTIFSPSIIDSHLFWQELCFFDLIEISIAPSDVSLAREEMDRPLFLMSKYCPKSASINVYYLYQLEFW